MFQTWADLLSVIAATRAQPVARRAMYSVSETPSKRSVVGQKVLCREPSLSVSPCHFLSAPNIDSESVVDACIDRAEEGSCVVFRCAVSLLLMEDPSVWTCMTNDSLIDDRLTTGEPQACASLSLGCSIRSDIAHTYDGGGLRDNGGEESASGADETSTCGWNESTFSKIHNPLTPSKGSFASVPPASTSHDGDRLTFQEEGTATCTEGYEAKSRVIASTTRTCHLDGYTSADAGWQFTICVTTTVLPCFASTLAQKKAGRDWSHKHDYERGLRRGLRH